MSWTHDQRRLTRTLRFLALPVLVIVAASCDRFTAITGGWNV